MIFNLVISIVVNGVEKPWNPDLECEAPAVRTIYRPIANCYGASAKSELFGYENPILEKSFILGEACYSLDDRRTIYIHTKHFQPQPKHNVSVRIMNTDFLTDNYRKSSQKVHMMEAIEPVALHQRLERLSLIKLPTLELRPILNLKNLPNGQLHPLLDTEWNMAITNGIDQLPNYDLLLADIMSIRANDFDLYLGTHPALNLKNIYNTNVRIGLYPGRTSFAVPKYLWANVVMRDSKKAIFFFVSNNIDSTEQELISTGPCQSKCTDISWLRNLLIEDAYRKPEKGYVWCCEQRNITEYVYGKPNIDNDYTFLN